MSRLAWNDPKDFKLTDAYRKEHPETPGFTWTNGIVHSHIDLTLMSQGLAASGAVVADHSVLTCRVDVPGTTRTGPGYWRLNITLLENMKIEQRYEEQFQDWTSLKCLFTSATDWWEDIKGRTRRFFQREGKRKACGRRAFLKRSQGRLQRLY